jgi:hypothetical protein
MVFRRAASIIDHDTIPSQARDHFNRFKEKNENNLELINRYKKAVALIDFTKDNVCDTFKDSWVTYDLLSGAEKTHGDHGQLSNQRISEKVTRKAVLNATTKSESRKNSPVRK